MQQSDPSSDDRRATRANDLYWRSDRSVNQIADELDVSKGTLYGLVRPLPTGLPCPECGAELEYPNRTARDRSLVACPECDLEEDEELVREAWRETAAGSPSGAVVVESRTSDGRRAVVTDAPSARLGNAGLAAALFLGAAAGLALVLWARRR